MATAGIHDLRSAAKRRQTSINRGMLTFCAVLMSLALFALPAGSEIPLIKRDCSICHGSHMGGTLVLLKKPLSELCLDCHPDRESPSEHVVDVVPSMEVIGLPLNGGMISCVTCHDPHNDSFGSLLRARPDELCEMCHRH